MSKLVKLKSFKDKYNWERERIFKINGFRLWEKKFKNFFCKWYK